MTKPSGGLGRGLDALLKGYGETPAPKDIQRIPIDSVRPNPFQPRRHFDPEAMQELAASIAEQGVLQPILVRQLPDSPKVYELVAGERRLRASKLAGKTDIPAIIKTFTDEESLAIALIENLQREDLNPIEEALGYQQLQQQFTLSQEALAKKVGKSRPAVTNALRLLQLPAEIQEDVQTNVISAGHARSLLAIPDEEARVQLWHRIKQEHLSVRDTERLVQAWKQGEGIAAAESKSQKRPPAARDPFLDRVQASILQGFKVPAKCTGNTRRGKIVLSYTSRDELQRVLHLLGIQYDE